ncbi:MAG: tetratricopeptide repeat protein [Candidatus Obscuribacterales bacterium]|nr:tetratricopeptide repeat protein [Candidatus Obscuribacterales bacterium]
MKASSLFKKLNQVGGVLACSFFLAVLLGTVCIVFNSQEAMVLGDPRDIVGRWAPDERWAKWQEDFDRGYSAYKRRDYILAQKIYLKTLEKAKSFGDNPSKCVEVLAKLICAIIDQGDPKKAEPYFQEVMALSIRLNKKNSLDELAAICMEDLAAAYEEHSGVTKGELPKTLNGQKDARYALQHAIDIHSKVFGDTHPKLIIVRSQYANVCIAQKDWNAAREQLEKVHSDVNKLRGKAWVHNSRWLIYLGCVYEKLGRKADASKVFAELKQHYDAAGLSGEIEKYRGSFCCMCGDYDTAEIWYRKQLADALREKSKYKEAYAIRNLGYTAEGKGRFAEAEKYFRKAYEMAKVYVKPDGTHKFFELAGEVERSMRNQKKNKEADEFHAKESSFLQYANPRFKSTTRLYQEEFEVLKDIDSISNKSRKELRKK